MQRMLDWRVARRMNFSANRLEISLGKHWHTQRLPPNRGSKQPVRARRVTPMRSEVRVYQSVFSLLGFAGEHSVGELLQETLDEVCRLTGSKVGFYHFVSENEKTLSLQAWSTATLRDYCKAEGERLHYDLDMAGVWADCVRERRAIIHNDYPSLPHRKGLPPGHAEVLRELVVPVFSRDRIVAILGVGNKPTEYADLDVETVTNFAQMAWVITERKLSEGALRESEQLLTTCQNIAGLGNYVLDVLTGTWASSAVLDDIFGIDQSFVRSVEAWSSLIHPDWREQMIDHLTNWALSKHNRFDKEYQIVRHCDGQQRWVHGMGEVVFDKVGQPVKMFGTILDITERKRAEEVLKESESKFRTAFMTGADAFSIATMKEGLILDVNSRFTDVFGYSADEACGRTSTELGLYSDSDRGRLLSEFRDKGHVADLEFTARRKSGELRSVLVSANSIKDGDEKLLLFVVRDITEQKRAEAERAKLEDQLRQAQKLESIGRLAGGVAHDFNNLLTVINGYSGFLLRALKAGDPLRSYAEEITTAGERAASLTKQLLAFSRKQVIEPKVVDVNALIRESTLMLRRLIGDDILLETHLDSSLGQVMADPDQIHQVIMNLAVNARDAMPDGGALDIETLNVELGKDDIAAIHPSGIPGRYVLMTVTDTGQGMNETIRKHIFEPFFTTKGVGKGTGLGLSTVYGIMRQNGGWIEVWSEVGIGTAFKVYLPRIDACAVEEEEMRLSVGGGGETILVVEDQEAVRSFAKAALRQHGYQVIQASDGDKALSVVKLHSEQIHLLLTDVVMPGLNGRELSERLKELRPNVKVLFISGYTADVIANRGVLDPGIAFLHKPFSQEELARKVREVLDQK